LVMVCILAKGSGDCDHPNTVSIRLTAFPEPDGRPRFYLTSSARV
jgi:hypothetical protein